MNRHLWSAAGVALAIALAIGLAASWQGMPEAGPKAVDSFQQRLNNAAAEPQNWMSYGNTYAEQRFSALTELSDANVGKLSLAWYYDFDNSRGQEGTPLVVDGVMYASSAWSKVYALDAATGRELWHYDPKVPGTAAFNGCCDVVNRGVAYHDGKVFVGTLDGRLVALNANTGKQIWSVVTVDQSKPYTITGAPRVFNGKVIIGNGGAEYGVRGYVTAYDVNTSKKIWRFYTVPGDPSAPADGAASDAVLAAKAKGSWHGRYWENGGGGTVWDAIVYDPEFNQVYLGVGNGSPWVHRLRSEGKGDNLFLSSIVALDADTGAYKWHYQETPGETWDFTASQQITLADLRIGGQNRKVLMQAPKNGFFYILDRKTGELLSAEKYTDVTWATHVDMKTGRPVEVPGARFEDKPFLNLPGGSGGHNWHPMSYSPKTGLVYIPLQQIPMLYVNEKNYKQRAGRWNLGVDLNFAPLPTSTADRKAAASALKGWLMAWDPVAGKEVWRVPHDGTWNGGTMATAGNLVFQGTSAGSFEAYRADNGKKLWSFATQAGVMAGPISYSVNGQQYVAVLAGYGGGAGLAIPAVLGGKAQPNGRVLVFKLGGTAKLPPHDFTLPPVMAPKVYWSTEQVKAGEQLFGVNCAMCHGLGTFSAGVLPDLKRSGALGDKNAWHAVVMGGVLSERGMVSFANMLTPAQAEDIRAFVAAKAVEEAGTK